ncbi:hypothetical protein PGT21_001960 [Puccinia graminis f. sp. tritici]|uniref:Uncharacterized protein n=1 Tax=Puccinia graminis f. sp. tritici TaxID=56615 RepID=A0A5B0Q4Y5_PUCGR|nr:hypothetical protein PGT21_001960 [Puccinia graminis f. sp. tritici]
MSIHLQLRSATSRMCCKNLQESNDASLSYHFFFLSRYFHLEQRTNWEIVPDGLVPKPRCRMLCEKKKKW